MKAFSADMNRCWRIKHKWNSLKHKYSLYSNTVTLSAMFWTVYEICKYQNDLFPYHVNHFNYEPAGKWIVDRWIVDK